MGISNLSETHHIIEIEQPEDDEKLWRYMDLSKYVSLLRSQSIYLTPLSALDDPFEGSNPQSLGLASVLEQSDTEGLIAQSLPSDISEMAAMASTVFKNGMYVSCWHLSAHESDAMWKLYSSTKDSICIQTTCGKLKRYIPNMNAQFGKVQYIDYATYVGPGTPITYNPAFFKRHSFEHEKEVRIVLADMEPHKYLANASAGHSPQADIGKTLTVDLKDLVDRILINPLAPAWFAEIVEDITLRYNFNFPVAQSELLAQPTF